MKSVLAILIILGVTSFGTALRCYFCVGSLDSDCGNGETSAMVIQECENRTMSDMPAELQEHYGDDRAVLEKCTAFSAKVAGMDIFERGCGYILEDTDLCEELTGLVEDLYSCQACDSDLCNI